MFWGKVGQVGTVGTREISIVLSIRYGVPTYRSYRYGVPTYRSYRRGGTGRGNNFRGERKIFRKRSYCMPKTIADLEPRAPVGIAFRARGDDETKEQALARLHEANPALAAPCRR